MTLKTMLPLTAMSALLCSAAAADPTGGYGLSSLAAGGASSLETHRPPSWAGGGGGGDNGGDTGDGSGSGSGVTAPTYYGWMSPGLETAWGWNGSTGYLGQGVTITVVDDFSSRNKYRGDLGDGKNRLRHGEWTLKQAGMVAPGAEMVADDFYDGGAVSLDSSRFDVLSLSYGYTAPLDRALEKSIVQAAANDSAFIAKSAGNEYGLPVGSRTDGGSDYLSLELIGTLGATGDTKSATAYDPVIFVGALDWNVVGTDDPSASLASYSSTAGSDANVQRQFLVVGVEAGSSAYSFGTGLAGTSFAAPIVAGYGAVLSSKFTAATPSAIAGRLLETAREDTIQGYTPALHGQGEADIALAISPDKIE